jgi:outer membrane receptor protein involved in Fe transport
MRPDRRFVFACLMSVSPALAEQPPAATGSGTAQNEGQTIQPQPATGSTGKENQTPGAAELPSVKIIQAPEAKKKRPPATVHTVTGRSTAASAAPGGLSPAEAASNAAVVQNAVTLDAARENILPKIGANSYGMSRQDIQALPQGDNAPLDKVLLQAPGVYQDTASNGGIHIRDEHGNIQYRINGIQLPDGVAGFGQVIETSIVGNMAVVTGALPAQYGLRTAGVVDIQTRAGTAEPAGEWSVYGGSHDTISSNIQYGGVSGNTQYFFTGRWLENDLGIENPTSSVNAIHDETQQEKFFSYVSTVLPNNSRWTMITGAAVGNYQIPNNPGQPAQFTLPGGQPAPLSANTNENQFEQNYYGVLAFQQSTGYSDYQISYFSRYSYLHYTPDTLADLAFNGIATNVTRESYLNGIQADGSYKVAPDHTLRAGFVVSAEQTKVTNQAVALVGSVSADGTITQDPCNCTTQFTDREDKLGFIAGVYIQDEWKITDKLTLNTGLRFDQMWQYVDANQLSPRIAAVYKPLDGTVFHAGYARYFTPPPQAVGAPANYILYNGTVAAAPVTPANVPGLVISPSLPERSHYFDAGVTQVLAPGLEVGLDAYYKIAQNLIDDGQFGQAYVLTAFNYAKGENEGLELKLKYAKEGVLVYGNLALVRQVGTQFASNQYLQNPADYTYVLSNYIATDHSQTLSASAGISYPVWDHTKASLDMIYGSGLRNGDHNSGTMPPYSQFNLGLSHEFVLPDWKPFTVRFDVVNLFDNVYELRDGSGIGMFAPQWGPRRGFFVGFSQKF